MKKSGTYEERIVKENRQKLKVMSSEEVRKWQMKKY
nr:MAG TPA: RPAP1-like protein [Caudoviricetes sp.]DAU88773.1 MAG TPA: RPAP1-like protein [Caudoviricetes sp.]